MARQPATAIRRIGNLDEGLSDRDGDLIGVRPSQFARGGNRASSLPSRAVEPRSFAVILQRTNAQE
jgi:hypothetical protein